MDADDNGKDDEDKNWLTHYLYYYITHWNKKEIRPPLSDKMNVKDWHQVGGDGRQVVGTIPDVISDARKGGDHIWIQKWDGVEKI